MNIYFSSATIQSYENKNSLMDLFYNPIVIFEDTKDLDIEKLKDIKWILKSEKFISHEFEILSINKASIKEDSKKFLEFKLVKKEVVFSYDNYSCKIFFSAKLDDIEIKHEVIGIVKTKWSRGLI